MVNRRGFRLPPILNMRIVLLIIFLLFTTTISADMLQVPFSCWPIELKKAFAEVGKKLDLSGVERTKDSWGYIKNEGNRYTIYTYKSVQKEDFEIIQKIVHRIELENS